MKAVTALCLSLAFATPPSRADDSVGVFGNRRALVIGIDGVRADSLQAANTPNIDALVATGAATYAAFAGGEIGTATQQATSSGPGWSSILTGVWTNRHGVTDNSFVGNDFASYPHLFQRIKESNAAACTASIVQWAPIDASIVATADAFTDHRATAGSGQSVADQTAAYLATQNPDVLFLHFDDVDHAGHASGYGPAIPAYLAAIEEVDEEIGEVITALESRPNYASEDWLVVVTTDHGGSGTGHGGQSAAERTIFLIASGGNVSNRVIAHGPGHTAVPPTVFEHLGIPVDPLWGWESEPFGFPPFCLDGLACTTDPGSHTVSLAWTPPDEIDATGIKVERDGNEIASLPLTADGYDDSPTVAGGGFVSFTYTVHTYGGTEGDACPVETCTAEFFDGPLDTDLVVHLALDGDTTDASGGGNTNDGTTNGAVSYLEGGVGQYLAFDANGEYVSLGSPADLSFGSDTDFSVSLLVRSSSPFTTDHAIASNKNWASGSNPGWIIAVNTNGSWQWNIGDGVDRLDYDGPPGQVRDGSWHHITAVHDRDGLVRLYFDGALVSEQGMAAIGSIDSLATAIATDGTLAYASFPGCVDEIRIWRRKLLPSEVAQLDASLVPKNCPTALACAVALPNEVTLTWNPAENLDATGLEILRADASIASLPITASSYIDTPPTNGDHVYRLRVLGNDAAICPELSCIATVGGSPFAGLVLDLRLDGDTLDASGQDNHGSLGGVPSYTGGISGSALTFNDLASPHQYVNLGTPVDLNFGTGTNFTVSVWVNNSAGFPDNRGSGGSADDPAIISNKDWNSGNNAGWVVAAGGNGRWQWNIGDGSARVDYDGPGGEISDGEWHHLLVSHDRDGDASLFYDGQQVATRSLVGIGNIDSGRPTAVATDGTLGAIWPNWFSGAIDRVRIWRRALSAAEVGFIYEHDSAWFRWREANFTAAQLADPEISGGLADPDADGWVNLFEFSAGGLPLAPQAPFAPTLSLMGGFLQLTYRRRAGGIGETGVDFTVDGICYTVEVSNDLSPDSWRSGATEVEAVGPSIDNGDGIETVTVRSRVVVGSALREFLRLRIRAK